MPLEPQEALDLPIDPDTEGEPVLSPMICFHCNVDFVPKFVRPEQKYCSSQCHDKAAEKRYREKNKQKLADRSKAHYKANKGAWKGYRKTQEQKVKEDPVYAENVREAKAEAAKNYHKNHPGYNALKQATQRAHKRKEKPLTMPNKVHKQSRAFSALTLLATARLLVREAKLCQSIEDRATLQKASELLTVVAASRMKAKKETKP